MNYGEGSVRFKDVELADCGDTTHVDSPHAKDGDIIGAAIFRSPEAMLNMTWGTATDIWSLGTTASTSNTFGTKRRIILTACLIA